MRQSPLHLGTLALKTSIKQIVRLIAAETDSQTKIKNMKDHVQAINESIEIDPMNTILRQGELSMLTYRLQKEKDELQRISHEKTFYTQELQRKIQSYRPMLCLLYPDFELNFLFDELQVFAQNEYPHNGKSLIEKLDFVTQMARTENDKTLAERYNKAIDEGVLNNA